MSKILEHPRSSKTVRPCAKPRATCAMSEASAQEGRAGGEGLDGGEHSSGRAGEAGGQQQQRPPPLSPSCLAPPSPGPAAVLLRRKNPHGPACSRVGDEFQARVPDAPCLSAAAARRGAAAAESARGDVRVNHPGERFALAPRPALRIAEERLFVALMHLFPKNFSYIGRVMGRDVATLLVHYYAVFKVGRSRRRSRPPAVWRPRARCRRGGAEGAGAGGGGAGAAACDAVGLLRPWQRGRAEGQAARRAAERAWAPLGAHRGVPTHLTSLETARRATPSTTACASRAGLCGPTARLTATRAPPPSSCGPPRWSVPPAQTAQPSAGHSLPCLANANA